MFLALQHRSDLRNSNAHFNYTKKATRITSYSFVGRFSAKNESKTRLFRIQHSCNRTQTQWSSVFIRARWRERVFLPYFLESYYWMDRLQMLAYCGFAYIDLLRKQYRVEEKSGFFSRAYFTS